MRFILPLLFLGCCTLFLSSSITKNQVAENAVLLGGEDGPTLPDAPFNYEDSGFPEHLVHTLWGENDSTVLEVVTNDGATLGRVLFYDEMLSANENISCGTCHKQEKSFADDTKFSEGINIDTRRNSMQLNDLGWSNKIGFFWDLSQADLKEMVRLPLQDENEVGLTDLEGVINRMNETDYYPDLFQKSFGSSTITLDRIQEALMQFITSMTTFNTKFDQHLRGQLELTAGEMEGHGIFEEACGMCHTDGQSFFFLGTETPQQAIEFNSFLFNNGLSIENGDVGVGDWNEQFEGLFKAPTLRNIAETGPYMHDGRFENLDEVLKHYNEGIEENDWGGLPIGGFQMPEESIANLKAFLLTMSDQTFLEDERFSDPFETTVDEENPIPLQANVSVYPNPSNAWTAIHFDNPNHQKAEVVLRNIQGQLIRKMSTNDEMLSLDVSQLATGTYIIALKIGNQFSEQKLMVN